MRINLTHFILLCSLFLGTSHVYAQQLEVLVDSLDKPSSLALKGDELFFSEEGAGNIWKIDISDPNAEPELVTSGLSAPTGLAIHNDDLYISNYGFESPINRLDISVPVANVFYSRQYTFSRGIIFDEDTLYVCEQTFPGFAPAAVSKVDINASLNSSPFSWLFSGITGPYDLAFYQNELYISDNFNDQIIKVDQYSINSQSVVVETNMSNPAGIDIANDKLYIAEYNGYQVLEIDLADPNASSKRVTLVDGGPVDVLVSNDRLYIAEYDDGEISVYDLSTTAVDEELQRALSIFPNPVSEYLVIDGLEGAELYEIVDGLGRIIQSGTVESNGRIILGSFEAGIYSLRLIGLGNAKFVKGH